MKNLLIKLFRNEEDLLLKTVVTITLVHLLIFTVNMCVRIASEFGYFDYFDFQNYIMEDEKLMETLNEVMSEHNDKEYTEEELEKNINNIKEYSVKQRINELKKEMKETLDVNKKMEIAKKIENINKEVLKW